MMLLPTSIEELSKIWATINQPYRFRSRYEVSLVEIAPDSAAAGRRRNSADHGRRRHHIRCAAT